MEVYANGNNERTATLACCAIMRGAEIPDDEW